MDLGSLKNGGKPKRIIYNTTHPRCTQWSLALRKGEYIEHSELNEPEDNGLKTFEDQKIGKDWRVDVPDIKVKDEKSPVEMRVSKEVKKIEPKQAKKDLTDNEISKLVWGDLKKPKGL